MELNIVTGKGTPSMETQTPGNAELGESQQSSFHGLGTSIYIQVYI